MGEVSSGPEPSGISSENEINIDDIVAFLADGDLTKKDYIYWNVTLDEAGKYAEIQSRKVLFRESVITFLTGSKDNQKTPEEISKIVKEKRKRWLQQKTLQ